MLISFEALHLPTDFFHFFFVSTELLLLHLTEDALRGQQITTAA